MAEQNAEFVAISRMTVTSLQETPPPNAESAFPRLSQWLNRTLRSDVPDSRPLTGYRLKSIKLTHVVT